MFFFEIFVGEGEGCGGGSGDANRAKVPATLKGAKRPSKFDSTMECPTAQRDFYCTWVETLTAKRPISQKKSLWRLCFLPLSSTAIHIYFEISFHCFLILISTAFIMISVSADSLLRHLKLLGGGGHLGFFFLSIKPLNCFLDSGFY